MNITDEQAAIINEIADHQDRGETLAHAVAATAEHWRAEQHRNDGGSDSDADSHYPDWFCV